ncbi:YiiX/YebB-like N1pC/P60 family cysteine hydrolase [Lentzea albidocapillata]|uniref:Permuted papain-like amidase enzyme, YaeF/YiiX, C92 family n=1 Tax=Lentzea albidocapillata TaxID=40571 RepID=A0A1W2FEG6_9PSEU|nr:YiiX/YebB-like N1pC/P60 family cysteine hydrolase [Lentzea albidocapillata]SMD19948.1 Permuted papain-like amidase enzyme, YaeF/YiiX, C92 family [Lentzea albidocapillata]
MGKIGRLLTSSIAASVVAGTAMAGLLVAPAQAAEVAPAQATETAAPDGDFDTASDADCTNKVKVGNSRYKGDIFHSYAKTVVPHNHVGIFYTTKIVVEAPGPKSLSQARTAATLNKCGPVYKMYVKAKQTTRNKAANYAYNSLRGKSYDLDFAINKTNTALRLNCSELVWRAYKHAGIELDSNGGPGVYPDNIKDDSSTVIYSTRR